MYLDLFVTERKLHVLPCLDGALVEHCHALILFMINSIKNFSIYVPPMSLYKVLSILNKKDITCIELGFYIPIG